LRPAGTAKVAWDYEIVWREKFQEGTFRLGKKPIYLQGDALSSGPIEVHAQIQQRHSK
jgi:hypothetical protein